MLSWDDEQTTAPAPRAPQTTSEAVPPAATAEVEDGAACYLRPGDDGFEECEACQ